MQRFLNWIGASLILHRLAATDLSRPRTMIKYQPNSFMHMLRHFDDGLSQHQMSLYQCLLLGLPVRTSSTDPLTFSCGQTRDWHGNHRLNCKQHAGHAFHAGHDVVRDQLSRELRRLEMIRFCDDEGQLKRRYPHPNSKKRGDIAVTGTTSSSLSPLTVYDPGPVLIAPRSSLMSR